MECKTLPRLNYNLLKEFILCNQILLFIYRNFPKYFDVIDQKNKWSIVTLENSVKVNYLNTEKHPDANHL
jgi:hypothetical protein